MPSKLLAVAGTRSFDDYEFLEAKLNRLTLKLDDFMLATNGMNDFDLLVERWATSRYITFQRFHPNPKLKKAGPQQAREDLVAAADVVICFWDGQSPNTETVIELAKEIGKPLRVIRY